MPVELACNQVVKIMNDMLAQIEWILQEDLLPVSPTGMVHYALSCDRMTWNYYIHVFSSVHHIWYFEFLVEKEADQSQSQFTSLNNQLLDL